MPSIENWNLKPLDIVQNIFENRKEDVKWINQVTEYFNDRLKVYSNMNVIRSLNETQLHDLKSGCLVRFRCMIQETHEPEYFIEEYEVKNEAHATTVQCSGAFKDALDISDDYDLSSNTMGCRQVLYCVSIPGETFWVKEKFRSHKPSSSASYSGGDQSEFNAGKRSHEEDDLMEQDEPMTNGLDLNKRQKRTNESARENRTLKKNHPLPEENGAVCIVKVYDEEREFKINEVYEFVGILSMDASLEYIPEAENQALNDSAEEYRAHHPPPSFAPRLHCVHMIKLEHNNPLLLHNRTLDFSKLKIKNELIKFLKHATFGDELAAEYLLMHLISRVYSRNGALPVGKFSLNISNVPPNSRYPLYLSFLLKRLMTKAFFLSMTLENLNKLSFIPTKNYNTNKLESGILQLSDGTHIIIDETVLRPGQLDVNGVKHVQAFNNLINFQKVDYNFQFHPLSFDHDVPVLILSEGKSLLPCDCQVSLTPAIAVPEDLQKYFENLDPSSDLFDNFRTYLTMSKLAEYELSEDIMKVIENDFVAARQTMNEKMTPDDLHTHLIIARLLSINSDQKNLTLETWRKVQVLETSRRSRLTLQ